jgi:hypothetical protein
MIDPSRNIPPAAGQSKREGSGLFQVRAVGRDEEGFWVLERNGQIFKVKTSAALTPGAFYKGFFLRKKDYIEFMLRRESPGESAVRLPQSLRSMPEPGSAEYSRLVLSRAFLRGGLNLPQGAALENMLKFAAAGLRREVLTRSALAVRCEGRGLSLDAEDYERLYAVLEGYDGDGGNGSGERRRKKEDQETRKDSGGENPLEPAAPGGTGGEKDSLLQLFNHLAEGPRTWIFYPYRCTLEDESYRGSLRVLYAFPENSEEKYVLSVRPLGGRGEKTCPPETACPGGGEERWYFAWNKPGSSGGLKIYYTGGGDKKNLLPGAWIRKFRKLGLFCDDSIYNGKIFDGFDEISEEAAGIDETV